jgi:saccharopine dehydrogenase-like NADP-dependent oxidoreductase
MNNNILIVGAGGVGAVAAHKCAQNNDVFGNICIASRTIEKCERIIKNIHEKNNLKDRSKKLYAKQIYIENKESVIELILKTKSDIVINVGSGYVNMPIMEACLDTEKAYIDTSVCENIEEINVPYPWYAKYEWKKKKEFEEKGITCILGVGFDPGVVNAYCAYALENEFDKIYQIDIIDVNAGNHGKFFATNFDPEINLREILEDVGYWKDRQWKMCKCHSRSKFYDLPKIGKHKVYLMGHDELHSLPINMDVDTIRFWMGFSDQYLNCFNVLKNIGLLNHMPVRTDDGKEVAPIKVVKACLPEPSSLAKDYTGITFIGNHINGLKDGYKKEIFIYNICDHEECYKEVNSQAISYTAGVPPVAAAMLIAQGPWDVKKMVNVEELEAKIFLDMLERLGLQTKIEKSIHHIEQPVSLT